jgi:hypothetical protein
MSVWDTISDTAGGLWEGMTGPITSAAGRMGVGQHSPPNAAAARGTPRAGVGPDINNYTLGNDPNWLANFSTGQSGVAQQGQNLVQGAQNVGAQGAGLMQQGQAAQYRQGPETAYNPAVGALQGQSMQGGQAQYGLAGQLAGLANAPQGPSAAQAQLQQGTNDALNSQLALARSGSGFGESSNAMAGAAQNSAGIQAANANQSAMLRAQEDASARARQAQLLGMSGEQLEQGRAADLALAQQQIGQGQFGTQANLAQQQANDALLGQMTGYGLQAQNMGLAGQAQGISAQNQANQLALQAAQAQQQGTQAYEGNVTDIYGMDQGAHDKARELNQANSNNWVNGVTGLLSGIGGLAGLSDVRAKKNIEHEDLSRVYRALGGDHA